MNPKEAAFEKISALVERFSEQSISYKHSDYNETLTRRDFIDPFFKALGWDIDNESGNAEAYREVIHEDKIKIGSATKAPDYSFRLPGGKRLFFVEAKKPSVFVKEEIPPAYQIRRYGWSAKLPVSIVTDFEEFAIYDCTKKPKPTDKASAARIKYLTYKEYLTEFDFIWDTFSKERVLKGSFDKFVLSDTGKKGTATVDKEFLESLNDWRKMLAESISVNNIKLNEDEINFAVQQTLDRIIFLRICEDRGVEPYEKLKYCLNPPVKEGSVYKNLFVYFEEADKKYNSGLFDLAKDSISRRLYIDNKILTKIIGELYYPESPYEFSVLSVEILGSAYEQFLGKVIRLTPSRKAKIEEKPEVRKAGGVYYTPQYIVDYIVKNTVGKLVEGKTPKEVEKIKIVDPACGSGSFLIGAYQYLLDWHLSYYMAGATHPGASRHPSPEGNRSKALTPDGRLTTAEKKRILINNIYGVDIDTQATEVTKLSLLLKCMEGETLASVQQTMSFMHERILPTLENNIKSGNSLIDMDFYDGELEFSGTERKIKPFNWQSAFPEVFKQGGFDCVIGNPPYLKLTLNSLESEIFTYYNNKYYTLKAGSSKNLFQLFIERMVNLKPKTISFIVPEAILTSSSNKLVRDLLTNNYKISSIVKFNHFVFEEATIGTTIFVAEKNKINIPTIIYLVDNEIEQHKIKEEEFTVNSETWDISSKREFSGLISKISKNKILLNELVEMSKGMVVKDRNEVLEVRKNKNNIPFLLGSNMQRYKYEYKFYANYDNLKIVGGTNSLKKHSTLPRLLIRRTGNIICAAFSDKLELLESTIYFLVSKEINLKYLLAILNSKLLTFYLKQKLLTNAQGFPQILMWQLDKLPIPKIDFTNPAEKKKHDEIVNLVETMLELNRELQKTKSAEEQERLNQRISYTDKKIDALVYELYDLTEEEIKVVEGE